MYNAIMFALVVNATASFAVAYSVFPTLNTMQKQGKIGHLIQWYGIFALSLEVGVSVLTFLTIIEGTESIYIADIPLPLFLLGAMALAGANISLWVMMFHKK